LVSSLQSVDGSIAIDTKGWAAGIYTVRTITTEKVNIGRVVIR
jgi:hypothetical protein